MIWIPSKIFELRNLLPKTQIMSTFAWNHLEEYSRKSSPTSHLQSQIERVYRSRTHPARPLLLVIVVFTLRVCCTRGRHCATATATPQCYCSSQRVVLFVSMLSLLSLLLLLSYIVTIVPSGYPEFATAVRGVRSRLLALSQAGCKLQQQWATGHVP